MTIIARIRAIITIAISTRITIVITLRRIMITPDPPPKKLA